MHDIPQHATLAQMREASRKLQYAAGKMGLEPLPDQFPWQVQRSMASLPFSYMVQPVQIPPKLSRWASIKQWLGGYMRKV
jgi:hypothetical protein